MNEEGLTADTIECDRAAHFLRHLSRQPRLFFYNQGVHKRFQRVRYYRIHILQKVMRGRVFVCVVRLRANILPDDISCRFD